MQPIRVQRKRTAGYKLPANTKCVNRGTKFGNPFKLVGDMIYVDAGHRRKILDRWICFYPDGGYNVEHIVNLFRDLLHNPDSHNNIEPEIRNRFIVMREHIHELRGYNIACFCSVDNFCHGDVLLEFANK